jgi:hypothetical protein
MAGDRVFAGALFALGIALASPCGAAQAGPDARAVARDVAHELAVQDRLPSEDPAPGGERVDGGGTWGPSASAPVPAGPVSGDFGIVLIWVAGAFLAVFVLASIVEAVSGGAPHRGRDARAADGADTAAAGGPRASLITADELAATGRYTEAMHQLLQDTVAALRRRLAADISDALTSREILRALDLRPPEHGALRDMIARVEQTWFAQRRAALDDYHAVRACFAVFAAGTPSR